MFGKGRFTRSFNQEEKSFVTLTSRPAKSGSKLREENENIRKRYFQKLDQVQILLNLFLNH